MTLNSIFNMDISEIINGLAWYLVYLTIAMASVGVVYLVVNVLIRRNLNRGIK